jgi:SAM-dependent methyltransferase
MTMDEQNDVNVDAILRKIKEEVRRRTSGGGASIEPVLPSTTTSTDPPPAFRVEEGAPMTLERLLTFRDVEFIHAAYRHILRREPDPGGLARYLGLLRSGSSTRLEVLVALRFSEEGRHAGVYISGLNRAYWTSRIARVPVVGYLLQLVYGISKLPVLMKNIASQDAQIAFQFSQSRHALDALQSKADREEVVALRAAANSAASVAMVVELQHHLARLEFAKANRKEIALLGERMNDSLLLKADRHEVAALAGQVETKADRQELAALAGQVELKAERQEVAALAERVEAKAERQEVAALAERVEVVGTSKVDQHHFSAIEGRIAQCENSRVDPNRVASLDYDLQTIEHQIALCRQDLQDQHRRLGLFLELARKRMPEAFTTEQLTKLLSEEDHFLDSLYVAFEDRFRGSREAIRDSLKVYLPYLQKHNRKSTNLLPLLDVACGRGEWLELLKEDGYSARGVDVNRVALQQCRELGLDVVEDDAIEFLRKQPKNAFSVVTCFHYVEHVDYRALVALLDESLRVLMPGGLAIFETPNARNILVTAGDFYRDPTHKNPVFPETLESIAELRGFTESAAYCFNETRTALIPLSTYAFDELSAYVRVSRDIAWIGVKPL